MPVPRMSSRLESTSAILGEYMLKGWTLTDLHCDTCRVTPLMREPPVEREGRARVQFCALCDGGPSPAPNPRAQATSTVPDVVSGPSMGSEDAASSISSLLLQGYSLLDSNCPQPTCRGIPLVGYPRKKDGSRDTRRMCVGCGGRWVQEGDLGGMKVVGETEKRRGDGGGESPRTRRRREMYGLDEEMQAGASRGKVARGFEEVEDEVEGMEIDSGKQPAEPIPIAPVLSNALKHTTSSLSATLDRLASSLGRQTEGSKSDEHRYFLDLKMHTEAMKDVLEVLGVVKRFGGSEGGGTQ